MSKRVEQIAFDRTPAMCLLHAQTLRWAAAQMTPQPAMFPMSETDRAYVEQELATLQQYLTNCAVWWESQGVAIYAILRPKRRQAQAKADDHGTN